MSSVAIEWVTYRQRRLAFLAALLALLLLVALVPLLPPSSFFAQYWWLLAPFLLGWVIVAQVRLLRWPCPRCSKPFFLRNLVFGNLFAKRCVHCGFPKWGVPSIDAPGA